MLKKYLLLLLTLFIVRSAFSENITHIFKKGDTLYSLSRKYKVPVNEIMSHNNIKDPLKIHVGQKLIIKKETNTYTIKKGDTLYSIARKNKLDFKNLLKINNFTQKTIIKVGQKIYLPVKANTDSLAKKRSNNETTTYVTMKTNETDFFWPVDGKIKKLDGKLHGSRISADKGEPVYSVSSGRVVWEGPYRGFGKVVFVESSGGYVYVYGGNEKTRVAVGDVVEPGSEIGLTGLDIHESSPGIYFSVYKNGEPVDVEKAPRL